MNWKELYAGCKEIQAFEHILSEIIDNFELDPNPIIIQGPNQILVFMADSVCVFAVFEVPHRYVYGLLVRRSNSLHILLYRFRASSQECDFHIRVSCRNFYCCQLGCWSTWCAQNQKQFLLWYTQNFAHMFRFFSVHVDNRKLL